MLILHRLSLGVEPRAHLTCWRAAHPVAVAKLMETIPRVVSCPDLLSPNSTKSQPSCASNFESGSTAARVYAIHVEPFFDDKHRATYNRQ
jgi:hypothetical protein